MNAIKSIRFECPRCALRLKSSRVASHFTCPGCKQRMPMPTIAEEPAPPLPRGLVKPVPPTASPRRRPGGFGWLWLCVAVCLVLCGSAVGYGVYGLKKSKPRPAEVAEVARPAAVDSVPVPKSIEQPKAKERDSNVEPEIIVEPELLGPPVMESDAPPVSVDPNPKAKEPTDDDAKTNAVKIAKNAGWKEFRSAEGKFRLMLPDGPTVAGKKVSWRKGDFTLSVEYHDLPEDKVKTNTPAKLLDEIQASQAKLWQDHGKANATPVKVGNHTGRDLVMLSDLRVQGFSGGELVGSSDKGAMVRCLLVGRRVYLITASEVEVGAKGFLDFVISASVIMNATFELID